jgi:hypothetical protein
MAAKTEEPEQDNPHDIARRKKTGQGNKTKSARTE